MFVYGSLRSGGSAHHLLQGADREVNGTLDGVSLIEQNGYPMLISGSQQVVGEVFRIPTGLWRALDAWEETPWVYCRRRRTLLDGRSVWVYERP